MFAACKSWVFKSGSKECYLKNQYDAAKKIPCADCISYDENSRSYVYQTHATVTKTITTTTSKWTALTFGGSGWGQASGSESCIFSLGKDQAKEYDLLPQPLFLNSAYMCCDACNQNDRERSLYLGLSEFRG